VSDSVSASPVATVTITLSHQGALVATTRTGADGRYILRAARAGAYELRARRLGYAAATRAVVLADSARVVRVDLRVVTVASQLAPITVTGGASVAVDTHTGDQTFQQSDYHGVPTTTTSQIIQQSIAGAARAPTGEVHIHGQHAEYTYYIDGVPVPAGISGTLNELFDPTVVDRIDFQTGAWDAEYGNKNIAIINVATRVPAGGLHSEVSAYQGSFGSDGQTALVSTNSGPFGFLLSGTRQETEMRREPVEAGPGNAPLNFHNAGQDQFGFGKLEYTPSPRDIVTLDLNASRTHFLVPFDSSFAVLNDNQTDDDGFANLGWRHRFGADAGTGRPNAPTHGGELFTALYLRRSSLGYVPGKNDQASFIFYPDTTDRYNVSERRSATTVGVKTDLALPVIPRTLTIKTGIDVSLVEGREDFNTIDSLQRPGPSVNANVRGGDAGGYVESVFNPSDHWELRTGVRLDHHVAPLAGDIHQVSPRVRLNWFPSAGTTVWVYFGRLFIPSNVEDFHVLASAADTGKVGLPTVPERDSYYETGITHRFLGGVVTKFDAYFRDDSPAIDDNTLPGTALTTTVNIGLVHVTGIESVIEVHPSGPLSGYVNVALSHASAHGPITGGFFPTAYPTGWFDQDHDQRLSITANGDYNARWGYASVTVIFGSGLTSGNPSAAPNHTGLFDFNPGVKVAPSTIVDPSIGTSLTVGRTILRPELLVDNLFNLHYILKGAFTSGPSVGRPRSIQLRVSVRQ